MSKILKVSVVSSAAAVASMCFLMACSADKKESQTATVLTADVAAQDSSRVNLYKLMQSLKLTENPADPTELIEDDSSRGALQTALVEAAKKSACGSIDVVEKVVLPSGGKRFLLKMIRQEEGRIFYSLLDVPNLSATAGQPLFVYANSRAKEGSATDELDSIVAPKDSVNLIPILSAQAFEFAGKSYPEIPATSAVTGDVDLVYTSTLCIFNHAKLVKVDDARTLDSFLLPSSSEFGGYKTVISGAGTGAWIALLTAARSGAMVLASEVEPSEFAHFDCAALVDPLYSLYAAETRLLLSALVAGNTEETRYKDIPTIKDLRYEFFRKFRTAELTSEQLAREILLRDGFATLPFSTVAIKNYSREPNDKGPHSGGFFVAHSRTQKAYPVNGSRIFANVFASVAFKFADVSNGTNFLYREYGDERALGSVEDYLSVQLDKKSLNKGEFIDDIFIRPPSFVGEDVPEYKWIIRGSAYKTPKQMTFAQEFENFYSTSCNVTQ